MWFKNVPVSLLITLVLRLLLAQGANILFVQPFTSKSHHVLFKPIVVELAKRGHNVTVITGHEYKNPPSNFHQIVGPPTEVWEIVGGERPNVFDMIDIAEETFHELILWRAGIKFVDGLLSSNNVKEFLSNDNRYDLVIVEQFYQEALYILAHKYNAPLVLITSFGSCMRHNIITRNPLQLATVRSEFIFIEDLTSFWGRLRNLYFTVYEYVWWKYWYLEEQQKLVKKHFPNLPEPVPHLYDVQKNISLMLMNSHFSLQHPMATLPNHIEIGGFHMTRSDEPLPADLKPLMDNAEGVIYMNFGSNVRSSELSSKVKNAIIKTFEKLDKFTILWKFEDDMTNKPKNVVIRNWMPQKSILAHPKIKVFISHGGLISTQEAFYSGVPIIGVPIYGDQYNNLLLLQNAGVGKILKYRNIEDELEKTLNEVLHNPAYTIKAKEMSRRFKDRLVDPMDTAMFWIDYVIRNNGSEYIKNPAIKLDWIAYNMLDVYAFIALIGLALILTMHFMFKCIFQGSLQYFSKIKQNKGKTAKKYKQK